MRIRNGLFILMLSAVLITGCKKEKPPTPPKPNGGNGNQTSGGGAGQVSQGTMVSVDDADIFADANEQFPTKIGDQAWDLKALDYVKGIPLMIESGSVYVVEFWATSSDASAASIPLLTELAQKYKDKKVNVVGVSREGVGAVREFVTGQAEKIGYGIAVDLDGTVHQAYMTSFKQKDVPYVFIVGADGKIAWHGSPTAEIEQALDTVLAAASVSPEESVLPEAFDALEEDVLPEEADAPQEKMEE